MKPLDIFLCIGMIATSAIAEPRQPDKVIYGDDDRIDVYQETDATRLAMAAATCGLFDSSDVTDNQDGTFTLDTFDYTVSGEPPCDGEAFANQPVSAFCSGFLAGDDIVVTAGHCLETESELSTIRFVFGFQMTDVDTAVTQFDENRVYTGIEILGHRLDGDFDFTVVKLDRPVTAPGALPLPIRRSGVIAEGTLVGVIGHPAGLPLKLAFGAQTEVADNSPTAYFVTNLDTYGGNSGSPVFNASTGVVEGVLVRGEDDFNFVGNCFESNQLDNADAGEDVSKSVTFDQFVPTGTEGEGAIEGEPSGDATLIFSEYIEGSSNNKAIEIYNPTGASVNLDGWSIRQYSNGATEPNNTLDLSTVLPSLPAGDTIVIANASSDPTILAVADTTSTVTFFNGDDALELVNGSTVVDMFGVVGEDPGVNWTDGALATNEQTLRRKAGVCTGNPNGFSPITRLSTEWEAFPQDTFIELGRHFVNCSIVVEGEGTTEGEGTPEGDGIVEGEGAVEGTVEGEPSGEGNLIFSEYIEGSSNNKAIEIFNPNGNSVNLTGWSIRQYSNGATDPANTLDLDTVASSLPAGETIVIANASADPTILAVADTTSTVTFFNGDDALELVNGTTVVDMFGVVGEDPGVNWTDGALATNEQTLRRKAGVCTGNPNGFNPITRLSTEWEAFPQNTFIELGSHFVNCSIVVEGEGTTEGEGTPEGEGIVEGEGAVEGTVEGEPSGEATLIFSEYIEGTSNNKAVEIYNPTGASVNLDGWSIRQYSNGATEPNNTLDLSTVLPSLPAGETIVIANPSADAAILAVADTTSTVTFFNGDDALELVDGDTIVDMFGVVGEDPGLNWTDGDFATNEQTLRRKAAVCSGNPDGFAPITRLSAEWDTFAQNTFGGLGAHTVDCSGIVEGEGVPEGEGTPEGEGVVEGEGVAEGEGSPSTCADGDAIYCEDFTDNFNDTTDNANDDLQDLTQVSVASAGNNANWHIFEFTGNPFARVNGFGADVASDDWLISPAFNLNDYENETLTFDTAYNFDGPDLELLVSTNYDPNVNANPGSATWLPYDFAIAATGNYTWSTSGPINLSGIASGNVHVAWRYTTTGTGPGQSRVWEVDNILLTGTAIGGEGEGTTEGEGGVEGDEECNPADPGTPHSADYEVDFIIALSELLRLIQFFNTGFISCDIGSEDGFSATFGDTSCAPHSSDYGTSQDWAIDLSELLRGIQFYNAQSYYECPDETTEDGYCPFNCPTN